MLYHYRHEIFRYDFILYCEQHLQMSAYTKEDISHANPPAGTANCYVQTKIFYMQ